MWCVGMVVPPAGWGTVLDFEGLAGEPVPYDYGGLNWIDPYLGNQWIVDPSHLPQNPTACALFDAGETPVEATISSASPIDFMSIEFAGLFGDTVELYGNGPGGQYSSGTIELDGSSMVRYEGQWLKITTLTIYFDSLFPGSIAIDNLAFERPSEPQLATIFKEDFETFAAQQDLLDAGWELQHGQYAATDGAIWHVDDEPLGGGGVRGVYVISDSYAEGELTSPKYIDERLISPEIDCTQFTEVHLEFLQDVAVYQGGYPERFNVHISNDPAHQTWQSNWVPFWKEENGNSSDPQSVDISEFADGKKIRIRWRYTANFDYWWAIDEVKVMGRPNVLRVKGIRINAAESQLSIAWEAPDGVFTIEASYAPAFFSSWQLAREITQKQWTGADPGVSDGQRFYRVRMD